MDEVEVARHTSERASGDKEESAGSRRKPFLVDIEGREASREAVTCSARRLEFTAPAFWLVAVRPTLTLGVTASRLTGAFATSGDATARLAMEGWLVTWLQVDEARLGP